MLKPVSFVLAAVLFAPAASAIDIDRANALLSKACTDAVQLPYDPNFSTRLAALEKAAEESPTALGELLARFTARMARQYAENRTPATGAAISACIAAYPEVRLDIIMLDEAPAETRTAGRDGRPG
jgi:hypothetical protein